MAVDLEAKKPNPTSSTHADISLAAAMRLSAMVLMLTSVVAAWLLSAQAMLTSADVISEVTKKLNRGGLMTNPWGPPFLLLPHRRDSLIQDAHPMIHQIGSNPSFEIRVKKRSQEFFR